MRHLPEFPASPARGRATTVHGVSVRRLAVLRLPLVALGGCVVAAALAAGLAGLAPEVAREPGVAILLRAMGAFKLLMVVCALGLLAWRARYPLGARRAAVYVIACWTAAGAAALIAQLAFVPAAAVAFHVAEITFLVAAWLDGRSMRARTPA